MSQTDLDTLKVFAHVTAPNAAVYRAIMAVFAEAKARFVLHLRPEEVLEGLIARGITHRDAEAGEEPVPLTREEVELSLRYLWDKGNIRGYQDTADVTTVEEFIRKRFLYQMTPAGEAAEAALAFFEQQLGTAGALQATALEDIARQLAALEVLASEDTPDPGRVSSSLGELSRRFESLTSQAQRFMADLQRTIDLYEIDIDDFMGYKDTLISYLDRFIHRLIVATNEIATLITRVEETGIEPLLEIVTDREAADAFNQTTEDRARRLGAWQASWSGFKSWFIGSHGRTSQAEILRSRALEAIPDLLSVVATINERRTTRADRLADLRILSRWFMECDSDADAHRLWRAAFGLHPSRHLRINDDTLVAWEEDDAGPRQSWLDGPKLQISPRLRQYGHTRRRGRPTPIIDRTQDKQKLARLAAEETRQLAAARARLATDAPCLLSELHVLDPREFDLFFDLLTRALGRKRREQDSVKALSTDGTMEIDLQPVEGAGIARVTTQLGVLRVRDHRIVITDLFPITVPEPVQPEEALW